MARKKPKSRKREARPPRVVREWRIPLWLPLILLPALVFAAYANSLDGGFVFDDRQIVEQNSQLINIETLDDVRAMGSGWRQLTTLTYGLNYYYGGLDTYGYHAVNTLIHAINAILVYLIILHLAGGQLFPALAGAAIFSVHPLMTEAVSNVAGRASSLCALFYALSILAFLKAIDSDNMKFRIGWLSLTALAGIVAFQSKQEAITLPVAMAGLVWIRSEKKNWRFLIPLALLPFAVVILIRDQLVSLYSAFMGNAVLVSAGFEEVLPITTYVRTYITAIVTYYFPRFVFPVGLSADPAIRPVEAWYGVDFLFALLVLGAIGWFLVRKKVPSRLVGAGAVMVMLSPLTAYAAVPLADVVLEHRAYIPGLGVAVLAAALFEWMKKQVGTLAPVAALVLVVIFTFMTVARNTAWADSISLWEDAKVKSAEKPRPHFNLAEAYQRTGRLAEALREYQHALDLKPDIHAAYSNIAAIHLDQGRLDEGEEVLLQVTELAPDFTEGFINLAVLYIRRREPDKAIEAVDKALAINPSSFSAHFNKGEALTVKGDFVAALDSYETAVDIRPDLPQFQLSLGVAYLRAGDRESTEEQFRTLLNEPAVAADAYRNLGSLYAQDGADEQAVEFLTEAIRRRQIYPDAHHDLGAAYMRQDMLDLALREFELTLSQQADYGPAHLNLALVHRMRGDNARALEILRTYISDFTATNAPYLAQAQERLQLWQ